MTSGIYCIKNIHNKKVYIGRSVNIERRCRKHFSLLKKGRHYNAHFQSAFDKYGEENFVVDILEVCDNREILPNREQFYITQYYQNWEMCYNNAKDTDGVTFLTAKQTEKVSDKLKGRKFSKEHREALSKSMRGKNNAFYKTGPKKATKASAEKTRKPLVMLDNKENIVQFFDSTKEAGKWCIENNFTDSKYAPTAIAKACRLNKKAYGYYWRYT